MEGNEMEHLIEGGRIFQLIEPQDGPNDATVTGDWVDLSGAQRAFIVFSVAEGDNADYTLDVVQNDGTAAGGAAKALSDDVPIWQDDDTSDPALEREDDDTEIDITGSSDDKLVVFQIDPAKALDVANGFYEITARIDTDDAGTDGSNQIISAMCYILPARYKSGRADA
jgi:hypothetical protein